MVNPKSSLLLSDVWDKIWPLVSLDQIDSGRIISALNSIDVRAGVSSHYVHSGASMLHIESSDPAVARIVVYGGSIPLGVIACRGDFDGWWVEKLSVRSSVYRTLEPICRRVGLPLEADPHIVLLRAHWHPQI